MARTNKRTVDKKEIIKLLERGIIALKKQRRKKITAGDVFNIIIDASVPGR